MSFAPTTAPSLSDRSSGSMHYACASGDANIGSAQPKVRWQVAGSHLHVVQLHASLLKASFVLELVRPMPEGIAPDASFGGRSAGTRTALALRRLAAIFASDVICYTLAAGGRAS
jgi:hypothetical protein